MLTLSLVVVLDGLVQHLDSIVEVHGRQILQRVLLEAGADPPELGDHPVLACSAEVASQQALSPLPLHMRPYHLDRVEDAGGRREEEELAVQLLEELGDLAAEVRAVVVQHDHGAAQVVLLGHFLEEFVNDVFVRSRRQSGEQPAAAEGADDGDVVLVLLAQFDPNAAARLPDSPRPLPEVGGRLIHVPNGLAHP